MVFPQMEIKQLPRLERFDLDFDLPEHFLPEFPPAIYLTTRPDLGDVSQGKVVTVENFQEIFARHPQRQGPGRPAAAGDAVPAAAVQRHGRPQDGEARSACRAWPASIATSTATRRRRPTWRATSGRRAHRRRIDTPSLRGVNIQRLFGSQRALKTIEDFTEFEQRAAYFDGDQVSAAAKGVNPLERGSQVHFMAEFQELLDFPPAPGLSLDGKLDPEEVRGRLAGDAGPEAVLRQGPVRDLPSGPVLHRQLDARPARSSASTRRRRSTAWSRPARGRSRRSPLRGIKESPPYFHDGRLLTLEDTVEFFNLILETQADRRGEEGPGGVHAAVVMGCPFAI